MMKSKAIFSAKNLSVIIFISIFLNFTNASAQQSLVNVNGWNAYVHLPWDYNVNKSSTYPTIIFFPGTGEVGSNASLVIQNGPGAYISQGWNGNVKVGTDSVKFIVISLQPSSLWPIEIDIDDKIQALKKMYRIDNQRLHLTGLSMGGWCSTTYVTADKYGGPYKNASQVATVVEVEGVRPDDNQPYPNLFDNFAKSGGRLLGFEQINDGRDIQTRVDRMNYTTANSGIFVSTNYGGGGHCCWEEFYGGNGNTPNNFSLDGINQNVYQWMARNPAPATSSNNQSPIADAGASQSITLPSSSVTLTGSGTDADGKVSSYSWTKISGPSSFSIKKSTSSSTSVTSLVQGVYVFQLTVTDNDGATATDAVTVTVKGAGNILPVADAGIDKSITLPLNTTILSGSGSDADGYIVDYSWAKISGPSAGSIVDASLPVIVINGLVLGVYEFELTVTDNLGATSADTMQIIMHQNKKNQAPVANAGSDVTINSPVNSLTLNGTGTDADGIIMAYSWSQISGTLAKIVSPNSQNTSITNLDAVGTYVFRLTVTDDDDDTGVNDVTVTVNPSLPASSPPTSSGKRKMIPIAADGGIYFFNNNFLQPGDTGCIQSGTYPYISLSGIVGTATQPITIINCGGQVINTGNNGTSYCFRIVNSRFFKFTGTGVSGIKYGFKAYWKGGFTGVGMSVRDSSSDYEIDHFEAQNVQNGFLCKIDPYDCEPGTWSTGWTIKDISFHDNYVHNTTGEGYYIINTGSIVTVKDCKGALIDVEPVKAIGVKVYNNICDSTGWDGIQVAASTNAEIYNNKVTNYGRANMNSQQAGILLGGKSNGSVYNNYINNGTGEGLEIFGTGKINIYNNVISNAGWDGTSSRQDGIAIDDRPQPYNFYGGLQVFVLNNTVVNAGRNAIHIFNSYGTMNAGNKVNNNLLVKPNNTSPYDNPYVNIDGKTVVDTSKNVRLAVISSAGFYNSNLNDYHLLSTSPAIDKGLNASSYGVTADVDGISRPQGVAFDAGAYEYNKGTAPPPPGNQAPVANAGGDQTIQLPKVKLFLDGRQSYDSDGTIKSYKWSIVSGPSGSSLLTATKDTTSITLINTGVYTVRLTVTDNGGLTSIDDVIITLQSSQVVPPPASYGKIIHVNVYDGKTPYNNSKWNNWNVNSNLTSNSFKYDDNTQSSVNAYLSGNERIVDNGSNYAPGAVSCPSPVLQFNSIATSDRDLTFYGLNNGKQYRIELYASRALNVSDTRFIIGNVSDTITVSNNVNDFARFNNINPSGGKIKVTLQRLGTWQYFAGFSILEQNGSILTAPASNPDILTQSGNIDNPASSKISEETTAAQTLQTDIFSLRNGMLTLKINSDQQQTMNLSVVDASGRTFLKTNVTLQKGFNSFEKYVPGITKGIYYIKLFTNKNFVVKPLLNNVP
ncbi:MAG: PKD domain-containing protein [Ginsengibacter sp.]